MKPRPRFLRWIGAFLCALPVLPFILVPLWNNVRMARLEGDFSRLAHPPQTQQLLEWTEIGNFGNGNHLDFFVGEVRQKTGNAPIAAFYRGATLPVPNGQTDPSQDVFKGRQKVEIDILPSPLPPGYHWNDWGMNTDFSRFAGAKNLYVVFVRNSGDGEGWEQMLDARAW